MVFLQTPNGDNNSMEDFDHRLLDGKYKVVRELGVGGFGRVVLAADTVIQKRFVAIKVLKDQNSERQKNLIEEMNFLASLQNPAIVTFHHHFNDNGTLHLVMEYCSNGSIRKKIQHGKGLEPNIVFQWGIHLADALDFVHNKGIVHHDIKPDNILFTADEHLKVGDFGVANKNIGTLPYMAPELFTEDNVSIHDRRIDIYALGITLLELACGNNPLFGLSPNELLLRKLRGDFIPSELPRWVQEILLKATHSTPELRFQTMMEFREAMTSKTVPLIIDSKRMEAHKLSIASEKLIIKKKWIKAEKLITAALERCPDSVPANVTAGKLQMRLKQIEKAKAFLDHALRLNPRVNIQKELGWINLDMGKYSIAISLLNDHLHREPLDAEAHNLLVHCFYATDRYELGADLSNQNLLNGDCFLNNHFLCRVLSGEKPENILNERCIKSPDNPFIKYNLDVINENPKSWNDDRIPLKSKLLFQDFRFRKKRKQPQVNKVSIEIPKKGKDDYSQTIVTIGRTSSNTISIPDNSVSRRHCVIVNYPNDVWIYDLDSTVGTFINGERVYGKMFLLGVCELTVGRCQLRVSSEAGILV
jgi:serine/threonine protein kinase